MITPFEHQHDEIEQAMQMHLSTLHDGFFDLLAALITILLGITSVLHACIRMAYACVGLVVLMLGMWIRGLQAVQAEVVQKSSTSPFRLRGEVRNE